MNDVSQEHIAVAVRMRPMNAREIDQGDRCCWKCNPDLNCIHQIDDKGSPIPNSIYSYDCVFGPEATTETVYQGVGKRIVDSFVKGINGTIFAYGQTSSGKTFTMHGDESSPGLLYLASKDIFDYIANTVEREFILRGSYVELYKEEVKDLLDPSTPSLRIRENYEREVYVESKEEVIHNYNDLLNLLHIGDKHRHIGVTNMNQQSSRSHTIFKIVCESRLREDFISSTSDPGGVLVGQLSLVDLAGSESVKYTGAKGETLEEARKINLSLSVLSRVISSLATKTENSHVSYRDSKLTRILQSSLNGNSRTAIIACVTPASTFCTETISTLKFAQRAKNVHTSARVNELLDDKSVIRKLKKEIESLKRQIQEGGSMGVPLPEVMAIPDTALLEKNRELTEVQSRLEDLSRDVRDKEILLQQRSTEKSSIEAELMLSQAREHDLQSKLSEVLTRVEYLEEQYKKERSEREEKERQCSELSELLQQTRDEVEEMKKRDLELWVESKRLSQNTSQQEESSGFSENSQVDIRDRILIEIESLKQRRKELESSLKEARELNETLQNEIKERNEATEKMESENERLSTQIIGLIPEVNSLKKENNELKGEIEGLEKERDRILVEKEGILSEMEELQELREYVVMVKEKNDELRRIQEDYQKEREQLRNELEEKTLDCEELRKELNQVEEEGRVAVAELERVHTQHNRLSDSYQEWEMNVQNEMKQLHGSLDKVNGEKEEAEKSLSRVIQEKEEMMKSSEQLTLEKEELKKSFDCLIQEKEKLASSLQSLTQEKERLTSNLQSVTHEKEELATNLQSLIQEKDRLTSNLQSVTHEKEELTSNLQSVIQEKDTLSAELSKKEGVLHALETQATLLDQKERKYLQEIEKLKVSKGESANQTRILENQVNELTLSVQEKEKEIQSSKAYVEQIRLQLRTLEAVIQSNDNEIDELKACVVVGDDDIDRLTKLLIKQKEKQVQDKATIYNQLQSDFEVYRQEMAAGYTQEEMMMINIREENKNMKATIKELQEQLEVERNTCEARIHEVEEASASLIDTRRSTISSMELPASTQKEIEEKDAMIQKVEEEKKQLEKQLKESEEKSDRLKQTIRSKYAEYKEMANYVKETRETNQMLVSDVELLKKKYTVAKARIASLEKSKLSTADMEKIKQLLITKEAKDKEVKDLRKELSRLSDSLKGLNNEKKELSNRLNQSLSVLEEKDARIGELENDLNEARGSSVGLYGSSKDYLENENLKMSIRIEDLEETVKNLRSQLKNKGKSPSDSQNDKTPSFSRKNRRRDEVDMKLQSPSKQSRLSEYDLDDVSKCNPQYICLLRLSIERNLNRISLSDLKSNL